MSQVLTSKIRRQICSKSFIFNNLRKQKAKAGGIAPPSTVLETVILLLNYANNRGPGNLTLTGFHRSALAKRCSKTVSA